MIWDTIEEWADSECCGPYPATLYKIVTKSRREVVADKLSVFGVDATWSRLAHTDQLRIITEDHMESSFTDIRKKRASERTSDADRPVCAKCGEIMTPENSMINPEYFLHDKCLPEKSHGEEIIEGFTEFRDDLRSENDEREHRVKMRVVRRCTLHRMKEIMDAADACNDDGHLFWSLWRRWSVYAGTDLEESAIVAIEELLDDIMQE